MTPHARKLAHLTLALLAAAAVTACATHPKFAPAPAAAPATPAPPPAAPAYTPPPAPATTAPLGPLPGSRQDFVINIGDRVYFDFDRYTVRADAEPVLARQAAWLQRYPAVRVRIEGNCDERGTREYNFALGSRRADQVRQFLVAHGVSDARITTVSYGKEQPIDSGADEAAWAHNRNAHTTLTGGAAQ